MRKFSPLWFFLPVAALFVWQNQNNPFFWDTVQLGSKHAHFFYENGLQWAPLPPEIDSGHPPFFGWLLAAAWTLFGKTLPVGHWLMFPFLAGSMALLWRIGLRLGGSERAAWLLPLVLLDPVVAGQSALVGPDMVLVFWFLLSVTGLLFGRRWWVAVGIAGLCTISMRGMMSAAALFVFAVYLRLLLIRVDSRFVQARTWPGAALPFLPGFLLAAGFLYWHWQSTGWVGFHAGSPWAGAFRRVDAHGALRNLLILGWRWTDLGRFAEWAFLLIFIFPRGKFRLSKLFWLWVILTLFLGYSALAYQNLSAHRYFLPAYLALHLFVFQQLAAMEWPAFRQKATFVLLIFCLATGNLWIYPRGISMDWDATLAHLPYHHLRADMIAFLESQHIAFEDVGSAFPNLNTGENLLLNGDQRHFAAFDLTRNQYVLVSNVFNDIGNQEYNTLERDWRLIRRAEQAGVWMALYQKQ